MSVATFRQQVDRQNVIPRFKCVRLSNYLNTCNRYDEATAQNQINHKKIEKINTNNGRV